MSAFSALFAQNNCENIRCLDFLPFAQNQRKSIPCLGFLLSAQNQCEPIRCLAFLPSAQNGPEDDGCLGFLLSAQNYCKDIRSLGFLPSAQNHCTKLDVWVFCLLLKIAPSIFDVLSLLKIVTKTIHVCLVFLLSLPKIRVHRDIRKSQSKILQNNTMFCSPPYIFTSVQTAPNRDFDQNVLVDLSCCALLFESAPYISVLSARGLYQKG
jgi:hypothetical protein